MHKRAGCMLFALGAAVMLAMPVRAVQRDGVIRITPHCGEEIVSDGETVIFRVGEASTEGYIIPGYDMMWIIPADEVFFPETALWMEKYANADPITCTAEQAGSVIFSGLSAGLYLVTQPVPAEGYASFSPFLAELPVGGEIWEAEAFPEIQADQSPKTGDHPAPILAAMGLVLSGSLLLALTEKRKE